MRTIKNLPESQKAAIQTVIDRMLVSGRQVESAFTFFLDFSDRMKASRAMLDYHKTTENLFFSMRYLPIRPQNWTEAFTSRQAIENRDQYVFDDQADVQVPLNYFFNPYINDPVISIYNILHYYGSDEELRIFYEAQDRLMARVAERIKALQIDDPKNPHKSIARHFNALANEFPNQFGYKGSVDSFFEYAADHIGFENLPSAPFYYELKDALGMAFEEFKVEDKASLFNAMARIMDRQGYNFTPGQVGMHFKRLFSARDKAELTGHMMQNYERDGSRAVMGVQAPRNIKVSDTAVAYTEDAARGDKVQPKSGWSWLRFGKNFE